MISSTLTSWKDFSCPSEVLYLFVRREPFTSTGAPTVMALKSGYFLFVHITQLVHCVSSWTAPSALRVILFVAMEKLHTLF